MADVIKKKAEELFKKFKEVSITEFFRKNKAHLGYSGKLRSLTTAVHEVVTNSLDACEEAGILPEINVELNVLGVEHYLILGRDNGPGIPEKHIASVFGKMLAGTKFHRNIQMRGQQGIGVSGVTMFSQMTTGKPIEVKTCTGKGRLMKVKLLLDFTKNKADIIEQGEEELTAEEESSSLSSDSFHKNWHGTELRVELKDVLYKMGEYSPSEYLRRTAIANPHATISFVDPEGNRTIYERSINEVPKPPIEMKPHPAGVEVDGLISLSKITKARRISSFLLQDFSRISSAKIKEIESKCNINLNKMPFRMSWAEAEELVAAFKSTSFMAPPTEGLRPIGEEQITATVLNILDPEFETVLTRNPQVHSGGIPFQIEVAIAFGGRAGRRINGQTRSETMRFANRAPLLFDAGGCAITKAVNSIEWKRYGIRDFDNAPVTVFVNLVSTYVPYTSAGKQSIADESQVIEEIKKALMDLGRKFQRFHSKKHRRAEKENQLNTLLRYARELSKSLAKLTQKKEKEILTKLENLIREKVDLKEELELEEESIEKGTDFPKEPPESEQTTLTDDEE
ncbi:MAG: DNA topoisomerase VI subunit B [Candidatus Altiarchaeota archaeon]